VLGLRNMSLMRESAAEAGADQSWTSARYVDDENQDWSQLELALAIQDSRFLHVGI
jgi:hypothetical protein